MILLSMFEYYKDKKVSNSQDSRSQESNKSLFKILTNSPNDFSLDLYALYKAKKNSRKIIRFKVLHQDRLIGNSSWNKNFFSKIKLTFLYMKSIIKILGLR